MCMDNNDLNTVSNCALNVSTSGTSSLCVGVNDVNGASYQAALDRLLAQELPTDKEELDKLLNTPIADIEPILSPEEVKRSEDRLLNLLMEIRELHERVKQITIKEAIRVSQLPAEIIQPIVERTFVKKAIRRPLMESEIRYAFSKTNDSIPKAAAYLGVCPKTLKKYCRFYDANSTTPVLIPLWKPERGIAAYHPKISAGGPTPPTV